MQCNYYYRGKVVKQNKTKISESGWCFFFLFSFLQAYCTDVYYIELFFFPVHNELIHDVVLKKKENCKCYFKLINVTDTLEEALCTHMYMMFKTVFRFCISSKSNV